MVRFWREGDCRQVIENLGSNNGCGTTHAHVEKVVGERQMSRGGVYSVSPS